ncbi:galactonate dehydratase [Pseudohyphozyma bogoriensis]|nr:galactonate dehydratase [Pseudohyphozyma bogoriensis]
MALTNGVHKPAPAPAPVANEHVHDTKYWTTGLLSPGADLIKSIETFRVKPRWLFVRVETEAGIVGWGEGTLEGHSESVEGAFADLQRFVGWDASCIEDIWQCCYRMRFYRGGPSLMSAMSGLDIALWDIAGKTLGVPVYKLLGGKVRERANVYSWIGGDKPSDVVAQAVERKAQGFKAVKMNATESLGWMDSPHSLDSAVERVAMVKATGIDVGVDYHGRLHKTLAKQLTRLLEPHRPLFIEEPLLAGHVDEIKTLYQQTTVPIALGERLYTRQDFRPYLEAGCIDVVQPDIAHAGGISETRRIVNLAETYDVGYAPHAPLGPISFAASLQVGFASPNFVICEMSWKIHYNKDDYDLFTYVSNPEDFKVSNGSIEILPRPGLGVVINEELVRKEAAATADFSWRNPMWRGDDGCLREW